MGPASKARNTPSPRFSTAGRRLAPRRVHEAEGGSVEQKTNRRARFTEQPLKTGVRACESAVMRPLGRGRTVEINLRFFDPDEQQPLIGALGIGHRTSR